MYSYLICGLRVASEVQLPGAIAEETRAEAADVSIRRGAVPATLQDATDSGPTWDMAGETFVLRVPNLARFAIVAGREIVAEIEPGVTERDAAGFILGSAFGILLHQRGAFVLHGSAVAKGGRAIAICGISGAGKSTLAAALCGDGCSFVTDDLCVISLDEKKQPIILPDGRQLKLWKESIDKLDLAGHRGAAVRESFAKYYIDPKGERAQPARLSAVYLIRRARLPRKVVIESMALPDALRALDYEAYRPEFRARLGQKTEILAHTAAVLGGAKVFRLSRQRGFEYLPETVAALQAHWDTLA